MFIIIYKDGHQEHTYDDFDLQVLDWTDVVEVINMNNIGCDQINYGGGTGRRFKRKVKAWASLEQHLTMQGANPCP